MDLPHVYPISGHFAWKPRHFTGGMGPGVWILAPMDPVMKHGRTIPCMKMMVIFPPKTSNNSIDFGDFPLPHLVSGDKWRNDTGFYRSQLSRDRWKTSKSRWINSKSPVDTVFIPCFIGFQHVSTILLVVQDFFRPRTMEDLWLVDGSVVHQKPTLLSTETL